MDSKLYFELFLLQCNYKEIDTDGVTNGVQVQNASFITERSRNRQFQTPANNNIRGQDKRVIQETDKGRGRQQTITTQGKSPKNKIHTVKARQG